LIIELHTIVLQLQNLAVDLQRWQSICSRPTSFYQAAFTKPLLLAKRTQCLFRDINQMYPGSWM